MMIVEREAASAERAPATPQDIGARDWATLALLSLLYILSFVDRFILALLVVPLKADLGLSDVQVGLLFGTAFAVFYGITGIPLARVADTRNRKHLIIAGVLLWSVCTMGSAWATSFAILALLRFGLAVGEAALTPSALSMLTDSFPARRRVLVCTLFSAAGMAGAATAYMIGAYVIGVVEQLVGAGSLGSLKVWQGVFLLVGAPGVLLSLLLALVAREPGRQGDAAEKPSLGALWQHIKGEGWLYTGLFAGAGFTQLIAYTMVAWGPTFLQRSYGITAQQAGYGFGMAHFFAAVGGTLVMPILFRHLAATGRTGVAAIAPVWIGGLGAIIIAVAPFLESVTLFLLCHALGGFMLTGMANTILLILQPILPSRMRATLTAIGLTCISGFGLGIGPPLAAFINGLAAGSALPMGWGITGSALVGLVGTCICFAVAAPRLKLALGRLASMA